MQKRLPEQIGVAAGQVIDSTGAISKQVDVLLYDRVRTPMLFTSPNGYDQLIPVEGVLAVVIRDRNASAGQVLVSGEE